MKATDSFAQNLFMGKNILVAGGTSGIGLALAAGFAATGGEVVALGSSPRRLDLARADNTLPKLSFAKLDVRDYEAVEGFVGKLDRLDVLVNCQGIARPEAEWDEATFLDVIDVNLSSVMRVSRAAFPLLKSSQGNIINVASMLSYLADEAVPAYTASKTGIIGLTRALAHKYGTVGVRVNAIAPGYHKTEMTKSDWSDPVSAEKIADRAATGRWGTVEDLVGPTLFLASAAAEFVTGVVLPVDGGYHTG